MWGAHTHTQTHVHHTHCTCTLHTHTDTSSYANTVTDSATRAHTHTHHVHTSSSHSLAFLVKTPFTLVIKNPSRTEDKIRENVENVTEKLKQLNIACILNHNDRSRKCSLTRGCKLQKNNYYSGIPVWVLRALSVLKVDMVQAWFSCKVFLKACRHGRMSPTACGM